MYWYIGSECDFNNRQIAKLKAAKSRCFIIFAQSKYPPVLLLEIPPNIIYRHTVHAHTYPATTPLNILPGVQLTITKYLSIGTDLVLGVYCPIGMSHSVGNG